ncbi:MAG: hypothetical protein OEO79_17630 [Gemmatimonadota bacterium]|nr:hypothetical protein [Gemmatimonadota bacterium]
MSLLLAVTPEAPAALVPLQINSDSFLILSEGGFASASTLGMVIATGAGLFWTICYICVIVHGFREKRPMIPAVAILLNVGWEVASVFGWGSYEPGMRYASLVWFGIDLIIVYQLFRFGGAHQRVNELKHRWYWAISLGVLFSAGGHLLFASYNGDAFGLEDSYLINLVMSILFIGMYFTYQDASKLARWIAWTKMLGTLCGSIGVTILLNTMAASPRAMWPNNLGFLYYLMIGCFVFDVAYIRILSRGRSVGAAKAAVVPAGV